MIISRKLNGYQFFFCFVNFYFSLSVSLIHQVGSSNLRALDLYFANTTEDSGEFISWIPVIIISKDIILKGAGGL